MQIRIGRQSEREPSLARRIGADPGVAPGSLHDAGRHRIKFQKDGGVGTESPGVGESGEDSFAPIKGPESEHALGDHPGPGEQFGFEQGRPAARLFRDRQEFGPRGSLLLALCRGLSGSHKFSIPA